MIATVTLVEVSCWCGMPHAVPSTLRDKQLRDHRDGKSQTGIFCPLGHEYIISGEGEAAKLKRQLEQAMQDTIRERQKRDQAEARARDAESSLTATKGVVTKLKKRTAAGVCPCCSRTVSQMQEHMAEKHPEYVHEQGIKVVARPRKAKTA